MPAWKSAPLYSAYHRRRCGIALRSEEFGQTTPDASALQTAVPASTPFIGPDVGSRAGVEVDRLALLLRGSAHRRMVASGSVYWPHAFLRFVVQSFTASVAKQSSGHSGGVVARIPPKDSNFRFMPILHFWNIK